MTFDEMQLLMQQVVINQRETQDIVKSIARDVPIGNATGWQRS
jgi:hypothetical protein